MSVCVKSDQPGVRRVLFPLSLVESTPTSGVDIACRKEGRPIKGIDGQPLREFLDRRIENLFGDLGKSIRTGMRMCVPDEDRWVNLQIQVLEEHDAVVDMLAWRWNDHPPTLRLGAEGIQRLARGSKRGSALLVGVGAKFCLDTIDGLSERDALIACLELIAQGSPEDRAELLAALAPDDIDVAGVFERFLRNGLEGNLDERQRLAAWLLARTQIELPYNASRVRSALQTITDVAQLRQQVYSIINETFQFDLDSRNAERVARWRREEGIRLVGGRFSRAFYLEAMLAASAKVFDTRVLTPSIEELDRIVQESRLNFLTEDLRESSTAMQSLGGEKQAIVNLLGEREISEAQVDGAINNFLKALRFVEQEIQKRVDDLLRERRDTILEERRKRDGVSPTWRRFQADRSEITYQCDRLRYQLMRIEEAVAAARKRDPAFVVFLQRLFPLDAINLGTVNEFVDPFFGEDEHVRQLICDCGHRMYITPNLSAWLQHCDDWVEALPAYASYTISPRPGSGYDIKPYVQRGILEDMFRRHAEDWALNIEEVMRSENVTLARQFLAESLEWIDRAKEIAQRRNESLEEGIRLLPEMAEHRDLIAGLAVLVEMAADEQARELARKMEVEQATRFQALGPFLRDCIHATDQESAANSASPLDDLAAALSSHDKSQTLTSILKKRNATKQLETYGDIALARRRDLPNLHVLTTLGPGETDTHIRNWLEESIALFNVTRARSLEDKVQKRIEEYESRVLSAAKRLVTELDLQGDLFAVMEEEGLDSENPKDHKTALLKLVLSYPEVGREVGALAAIAEAKGELDFLAQEKVLPSVLDVCSSHPELEKEAIGKVVAENELESHPKEPRESVATLVDQNPDWRREKESHMYGEARRRLVEELGLQQEAASYLKRRMRNMHAVLHARREIIAESGRCADLENPRYRYEATGPYKRYNILYTPSRVDLGAQEVHSVKNVPKWVGGIDVDAANSGRSFYGLYNMAGVTAVDSPRLAEFLKVGENFFSRGGVFYLSLTAGINIDVLGIGDFEFFRDQWNMRGDRMVLPTGETYGGFCVPKEFSLLYAIIVAALRPATSEDLFNSFGVPKKIRGEVTKDLRGALRLWTESDSILDWEEKARAFLEPRLKAYGEMLGGPGFIARLPRLASTLEQLGVLGREDEEDRRDQYAFTDWVNKKAQGLEEINRAGPFRKVHLIQSLLNSARRRNSRIASDGDCIGVMGASYKEGERIAGKEIPISDVRFSAGARKLAIYAGMAEKHLLLDLDPDGRELVKRLMRGLVSPADLRLVGRCAGSDILNYVPGSGLEDAKEEALDALQQASLDENTINANCEVYGGDLKRWAGVKDLPEKERKALLEKVGSRIHLVVIDRRGPCRSYREAVQGSDFIDLGIPDPELLDLIDDLPKLVTLMRRGRPDSALVFADGASGGRRRAFSYRYASSERKVKELLALESNAVYGALGLGGETIEAWRAEMERDRKQAVALLAALRRKDPTGATQILERIRENVIRHRRAERAAADEVKARQAHCSQQVLRSYHLASEAMSRIKRGLQRGHLDFGTWLILGGMYELNGRHTQERINELRKEFESLIQSSGAGSGDLPGLSAEMVDDVILAFIRPVFILPKESEYREVSTGIEGSLKAAEEQVSRLARRAARRKQAQLATRQRQQRRAFLNESPEGNAKRLYDRATSFLGDGEQVIGAEDYGRFLAWAKAHVSRIAADQGSSDPKITAQIEAFFGTGIVSEDGYLPLASALAKAAEKHSEDSQALVHCAKTLELIDRALLIERTIGVDDADEMMVQIARYFDTTINSHIFDYIPYHYHKQRSAAFEALSREQKIDFACQRHQWLYKYARTLMLQHTRLAETDEEYQSIWIGDATRGQLPLGVRAETESERFWFSYARLRDASVLVHDGYPLPELLLDVSPGSLLADQRPTVGIIYPFGNTTVPVALEQGHRLARDENINLILTAFPTIEQTPPLPSPRREKGERHGYSPRLRGDTGGGSRFDQQVLHIHDGLMYLNAVDFERLLRAAGRTEEEIRRRCSTLGDEGVLVAVQLSQPLIADAVFFHFTHPLRPEVGQVGCPLIQPILWEAATHLKCALPDMLKGSGVRTADQFSWYKRERRVLSVQEGMAEVERRLTDFTQSHDVVIVKPEKESGGRRAKILPVRQDGTLLRDNLRELSELIYDISKTDNAVVQSVIPSHVRQLFTRVFLESMVDRFARIGVTCHLDREPQTPLFCYFRQIVVRGAEDYEISHHITVVSTAGIANVGQGGLLYEYTDDIIDPKYREDLRTEITRAALNSLVSQRKYIREHWQEILDEYLDIYPEFQSRVPRRLGKDVTGMEDSDIPYEMGDYMPFMLVDEEDHYTAVYDREKEKISPLYNADGSPTEVEIFNANKKRVSRVDAEGRPIRLRAFDGTGNRVSLFDHRGEPLQTLVVFKVEANPGAGLWRPHNDQLPPERKGEGVYTIFRCLGQRARLYKDSLARLRDGKLAPETASVDTRFIPSTCAGDLVGKAVRLMEEEMNS